MLAARLLLRRSPVVAALLAVVLVLTSCGSLRPEPPLQVTVITPGEPILAILNNCPALRDVSMRDSDGVVWQVSRRSPSPNAANIEMRIGGTPNGWETTTELADPMLDDTSYTLRTGPGGNELTFRVSDLVVGQAFTTDGNRTLERADASKSCNADVAWGNLWRQGAVFFILGLLVLLLVGTALVKLMSVFVPPRTDAYFEEDDWEDAEWEYEDDGWEDDPPLR